MPGLGQNSSQVPPVAKSGTHRPWLLPRTMTGGGGRPPVLGPERTTCIQKLALVPPHTLVLYRRLTGARRWRVHNLDCTCRAVKGTLGCGLHDIGVADSNCTTSVEVLFKCSDNFIRVSEKWDGSIVVGRRGRGRAGVDSNSKSSCESCRDSGVHFNGFDLFDLLNCEWA